MFFLLLPVHNRLEDTKKFIQHLCNQSYKKFKVIVVDDGSDDDTSAYIESHYPWILLLKGDGNLWWTGSINMALQTALKLAGDQDHIMTINNDLCFDSDFLQRMAEITSQYPDAIFNPMSTTGETKKTIFYTGGKVISWFFAIKKYPYLGKSIDAIDRSKLIEVDYLYGRGTTIPVTVFNHIGIYNEEQLPHYGADEEFTCRAKKNGFKLFIAPSVYVSVSKNTTGLNPTVRRLRFTELVRSFRSIKSQNNLLTVWRISKLMPPPYATPTYFLMSCVKIIFINFVLNFFWKSR